VDSEVSTLIERGRQLVGHCVSQMDRKSKRAFHDIVDSLVDLDGLLTRDSINPVSELAPLRVIEERLISRLRVLFAIGWQPLDLAHVVRQQTSPQVANSLIRALQLELEQSPFAAWVPVWWAEQMLQLERILPKRDPTASVSDALETSLMLLGRLDSLRPISSLSSPPAQWELNANRVVRTTTISEPSSSASTKILATVRSLLAKAEGTDFSAEADAFAEKAQEMMTRHSIDLAMLDERHGAQLTAGVNARRFHIDEPYAREKVGLLASVGSVNQVRVIFDNRYGLANTVGFAEDLDVTDLLFTSLLLQGGQAASALTLQGSKQQTFRRAFWLSFADRIAERLESAKQRATAESTSTYGDALVPMLKERSGAVDARVDELFTNVTSMTTKSVDARGWMAGRDAADLARIKNHGSK
jgi:Protein of unknown function (DUF2786)